MPRRLVLAAAFATGLFLPLAPTARAADGLIVNASAAYDVRPTERIAVVTVDVAATNVTPDTATEQTYYTGISLPIPIEAASVTATSGGAALAVGLSPADEFVTYAEIEFHQGVFYQQTYRFTLSFVLEDAGGDAERETWIRSRFVALPVWAFGSPDGTSRVEVALPRGFEATIVQGEMDVAASSGATRLVAEDVDPSTFFAYVTAERGGDRARHKLEVEMADGAVRLLLHAWPDDPEWADRQGRVLATGLPLLERVIGLPYPIDGTLHVTEHAYQHLGNYAGFFIGGTDSIEMRFDADAFTALHEAAHVWFNPDLAEERWLVEGFASYYAEIVGRRLDMELAMAELTREVRQAAFPLLEWSGVGVEDPEREAYGYAASHELARRIAKLAGRDGLRAVWRAADEGRLVYGTHPDADGAGRPNPDDWRRFLDLLEETVPADFDPLWTEWLLDERRAAELSERETARTAYRATQAAMGEWLMPDTTRRHMEAWAFEKATAELTRLDELVASHAAMVASAQRLDMSATDEVGQLLGEGIDAAARELDRQERAIDVITTVAERLAAEPALIEQIGLIGTDSPERWLASAREAFEAGDEGAAERHAEAADAIAARAEADGRLRVAVVGGAVLALDLVGMAVMLVRRRRRRGPAVERDAAA